MSVVRHPNPACACRDDIALHDDMLHLFPRYWAAVPPAYDYIVVGHIPRHFNVTRQAVSGAQHAASVCAANTARPSLLVQPLHSLRQHVDEGRHGDSI